MKKRVMRVAVALVLGLILAAVIAAYQIQDEKLDRLALEEKQSGKPDIVAKNFGGPFTLTDQNGEKFTQEDLEGQSHLLYFGFTYCPAICPTELQKISRALNELGADGNDILPVFITVDPERDTTATMRDYIKLFHPRLIGLRGNKAQTKQVMDAYKIYAAKVQTPEMSDYTVDHSSFIYWVDADGHLRRIFRIQDSAEDIVSAIRAL